MKCNCIVSFFVFSIVNANARKSYKTGLFQQGSTVSNIAGVVI